MLALTVMVTSCPMVDTVETVGGGTGANQPKTPDGAIPEGTGPVGKPADPIIPAFFYLNGRKPTPTDTGRTGFMVANLAAAANLLVMSEDLPEADPVVYFYGIEGISSAEIQFERGEDFPRSFVIREEGGTETTAVFSGYDSKTSTFSAEVSDGSITETYDDLVLNSGVFAAYTDDDTLSESQNLRVKNIVTSLALWASLVYQTGGASVAVERNEVGAYLFFAGGVKQAFTKVAQVFMVAAVVAVAVAVLACTAAVIATVSPVAFAVVAPVAVAVVKVSLGVSFVSGILSVGFQAIADKIPEKETPEDPAPPEPPVQHNTGDPGPEGGILIVVDKGGGSYDLYEAAPDDLGLLKIQGGAAAAACEGYSTSPDGKKDWFLPDYEQLFYIYDVYKMDVLDCQPEFYWSSTVHYNPGESDPYYVAIDFESGKPQYLSSANGSFLVRPVRRVSEEELATLPPSPSSQTDQTDSQADQTTPSQPGRPTPSSPEDIIFGPIYNKAV
ncbi:MAG: DUF1566 domain-containing protein [Spirochaetaceae bacterium]|nr:DUF1566 domain-containing protein [Spirochaetaceae bacterium]